jgi:hypothetical protein
MSGWMGSTECARTVDALEMSRIYAGRSGWDAGAGAGAGEASLTVLSEAAEAWALALVLVLVLGEGFDEAGVERAMGDEYTRRGCGEK